jgi:hypothetical protein
MIRSILTSPRTAIVAAVLAVGAASAVNFATAGGKTNGTGHVALNADASMRHQTSAFKGAKANTGYAIHYVENGKNILAVSDDFEIPNTPAPSWQIVDSRGNVYLLNQFKIKGGTNRKITLPAYVQDVAKVQVWCSYAEVLLGEASFDQPVALAK